MLPRNNELLCGVVEGFYGRPWRTDQRKDLFCLMKRLGLNTYMYAPKDDAKHRAYWRELYSVEEADHLTALITAARESDVQFVYALSPGLDITYSSPKELTALKRKLEQVSQFGCKAFAILFDDIDTDLCQADKDGFQSLAHAQVSVTNEVYEHLNRPCFLFCPTEYCATRATPSVETSEYLAITGSKLHPEILFMWTGPKVVSKTISCESIKQLSSVIKRKPVIWDNIHANDYDQKRLFLGPYEGRSTELIPYLNGVLTNPNCEFESNYIAFHTLSSWAKSDLEDDKQDHAMGDISDNPTIAAEIKLERDGDNETPQSPTPHYGRYNPASALKAAIVDWFEVIQESRTAEGLRIKSPALINANLAAVTASTTPIPSINTCMAITQTTNSAISPLPPEGTINSDLIKNKSMLENLVNSGSNYTPIMNPVNSLVTKSTDEVLEPMDCLPEMDSSKSNVVPTKMSSVVSVCPPTVSKNFDNVMQVDDIVNKDTNSRSDSSSNTDTTDTEMQIDTDQNAKPSSVQNEPICETASLETEAKKHGTEKLTVDDIALLVDLFYLPYEHGKQAVHLLEECFWLKSNAYTVNEAKKKGSPSDKALEWSERAARFVENGKRMKVMFTRLMNIPNRALLYDIYSYIWDIEGVISLLMSFVKWLAHGLIQQKHSHILHSYYSWGNHTHREAFMSGDLEPWVFRGGLTGELQRMLPIDGANDLFYKIPPKQICNKIYTIRPFRVSDELGIFRQCRLTYQDGKDATDLFPDHLRLPGNKKVGALLTFSPEYCFVAEEDGDLCGYALATLDSMEFQKKCEVAWLPEMCMKYPKPEKTEDLTLAEEIIVSFHNHKPFRPVNMFQRFPSLLTMSVLPEVEDQGVLKNLLACILSALKANGSHGAYSEVMKSDNAMIDFYKKLGFFDVPLVDDQDVDFVILGRTI